MWRKQIRAARGSRGKEYAFEDMFSEVRKYLKVADLAIGNLETTFSGREEEYQRTNPKTSYPMFNCPDELALALRNVGLNILTTANNHCMDRGENGLKRTIRILDRHQIHHTGTFSSPNEARQFLIEDVKRIKVGVLAYTYGTNFIPVPRGRPWLVNRIRWNKIVSDIGQLRRQVDVIIVAMHFGREFCRYPGNTQIQMIDRLFYHGADIVLGAHPHVLQPMQWKSVKDKYGVLKKRFVAHSLGNFISDRMMNNPLTQLGAILELDVHRDVKGFVAVNRAKFVPTWTLREGTIEKPRFRIIPVRKLPNSIRKSWSSAEQKAIERMLRATMRTSW